MYLLRYFAQGIALILYFYEQNKMPVILR